MRHRADHNQAEIIKALKRIGCDVRQIGRPVDLLVGYRQSNFLLEIKNPDGSYKGTKAQKDFLESWRGQVDIVHTAEQAIRIVTKT